MRKLLLFALALIPTLSSVAQDTFISGGIRFEISPDIDDTTVYVVPLGETEKYQGDVTVPANVVYNGVKYYVIGIQAGAFRNSPNLTSVTISDGILHIAEFAFANCSQLSTINIPASVRFVDAYAFNNTPWYNNKPDGVFYVGTLVCGYKGAMPENAAITIADGTTSIGACAFEGCTNLASVYIPSSVVSIDYCAFQGCTGLNDIALPENLNYIGLNAFYNTGWYNSQPNGSVLYLGSVLYDCKENVFVDTVTIKSGTTMICTGAFAHQQNIRHISIPEGVTHISTEAFYDCENLDSIRLPKSVKNIGRYAFGDCKKLKKINIPEGMTYIPGGIFDNCRSLQKVDIPSSVTLIQYGAFKGCEGFTDMDIPSSITSIEGASFRGCSNLKTVTFPEGVTFVGDNAFDGCNKLESVTSFAVTPPASDFNYNIFSSTAYSNAVLYVPAESVNDYKTADGWSQFQSIRAIGTTNVDLIDDDNVAIRYYDLSGKMIDAPQRGFNIIKYSNGQTKKVFVEE